MTKPISVVCPYCHTLQEPVLASEGVGAFFDIAISIYKNPIKAYRGFAKTLSAAMDGVEYSPAFICGHCRKIFVVCPACNSATLVEADEVFKHVNCSNCKRLINVCETYDE
jgi:hypothetical protein